MSREEISSMMREIFTWITTAKARDQRAIKKIGIRTLAAVWVTNPEIMESCPSHMVAKSFGISPQIMRTYSAEFSRRFKIQNRFQMMHDWQNPRRPC